MSETDKFNPTKARLPIPAEFPLLADQVDMEALAEMVGPEVLLYLARQNASPAGIALSPECTDPKMRPGAHADSFFIDPKTGCLNDKVNLTPNINVTGWNIEKWGVSKEGAVEAWNGIGTGVSNVAESIGTLAHTANSASNFLSLVEHPYDYVTGDYEREFLTAETPELYGIADEDRQATGAAATLLLVLATGAYIGMAGAKNVDSAGRANIAGSLALAFGVKMPTYLAGGALAAQYRNYQDKYGMTPSAAYLKAASPIGWYDSLIDSEDQFEPYITADMVSTIVIEGTISVRVGRAGFIVGRTTNTMLFPGGITTFPGAQKLRGVAESGLSQLNAVWNASREGIVSKLPPQVSAPLQRSAATVQKFARGAWAASTGPLPFINKVLNDRIAEMDAATAKIDAFTREQKSAQSKLSALQGKKGRSLGVGERGRQILETKQKLDVATTGLENAAEEIRQHQAFFKTLETETGIPVSHVMNASRGSLGSIGNAKNKVVEEIAEVERLIAKKEGMLSSHFSSHRSDRLARATLRKEVRSLRTQLGRLSHLQVELIRLKAAKEAGIDIARLREEVSTVRETITDLGTKFKKLNRSQRMILREQINAQTVRLEKLETDIALHEIHFVRSAEDVRHLGKVAFRNGLHQGSFEAAQLGLVQRLLGGQAKGYEGSAALSALESADTAVFQPRAHELGTYGRSGFRGKIAHGLANAFRHGRIASTATRLAGLWAVYYPESVLTYHYVWGMDWGNAAESATSMFWTVPSNMPWQNMLKNAFGFKSLSYLILSIPSQTGVNGYWSITKWDKKVMANRCRGLRGSMVESVSPEYRSMLRQKVDDFWVMASEEERAEWSERCDFAPSAEVVKRNPSPEEYFKERGFRD